MKKKNSSYYQFITPYLERGNATEIKEAKTLYRRKYKAEWRKLKRRQIKEITTAWEKEEYNTLRTEATGHKESITQFIKKATVGYMNKRYVVPNEVQVNKVMQLLALIYNGIAELQDESTIPVEVGKKLLLDINQLEREIRIELFSPKTIEQMILEYIWEKPQGKSLLIEFIKTIAI